MVMSYVNTGSYDRLRRRQAFKISLVYTVLFIWYAPTVYVAPQVNISQTSIALERQQ